jgi:hypothetical protein
VPGPAEPGRATSSRASRTGPSASTTRVMRDRLSTSPWSGRRGSPRAKGFTAVTGPGRSPGSTVRKTGNAPGLTLKPRSESSSGSPHPSGQRRACQTAALQTQVSERAISGPRPNLVSVPPGRGFGTWRSNPCEGVECPRTSHDRSSRQAWPLRSPDTPARKHAEGTCAAPRPFGLNPTAGHDFRPFVWKKARVIRIPRARTMAYRPLMRASYKDSSSVPAAGRIHQIVRKD